MVYALFLLLCPYLFLSCDDDSRLCPLQDEYHNKRIFVQYVAQEALHPLNTAIQGFSWLVDDASKASLNNSVRGAGQMALAAALPTNGDSMNEGFGVSNKILEMREHCLTSKKCLMDLVKFDKFDTGAILGHREDINMFKFIRAQADYFSTQMYHKRLNLRYFSRLNDNAPIEDDAGGVSFMASSYSFGGPTLIGNAANQSFDDIIIGDCVKTSTVLGNKHKLTQVFRHLIHNALRFSPVNGDICVIVHLKERLDDTSTTPTLPRYGHGHGHGHIRKTLSMGSVDEGSSIASEDFDSGDDTRVRDGKPSHTLRIEIRDRGPGVEKVDVPKLFSKRRQRSADKGGIGLWRKCFVLLMCCFV